jgi:hypothetical protein
MRQGRRYHPVATKRRRYFRLAASEFGFNLLCGSHRPLHLCVKASSRLVAAIATPSVLWFAVTFPPAVSTRENKMSGFALGVHLPIDSRDG